MENKNILASLTNIANELDNNGLFDEANVVTKIAESLTRKITAQSYDRKSNYLDNEIKRFQGRSEREEAENRRNQAYQRIINYAKDFLYDDPSSKMTKEQRLRNANDYIFGEMNRNPLLTKEQKDALSKQWERIKTNFREGKYVDIPRLDVKDITEEVKRRPDKKPRTTVTKPSDKLEPSKPTAVQPKDTDADIESKLYRWINKAENIYRKWENTPATSRDNASIMSLIQDISDYLKQMKSYSSNRAKPFIDNAIKKVDQMYAKVAVGVGDLGTTTMFSPEYKDVTGFPRKEKDPFDTGDRLTGQKLKEQAKLEGRSL